MGLKENDYIKQVETRDKFKALEMYKCVFLFKYDIKTCCYRIARVLNINSYKQREFKLCYEQLVWYCKSLMIRDFHLHARINVRIKSCFSTCNVKHIDFHY